MSSKENVLSGKTSSRSRPSVDKPRGDLMKKRASSVEETNIRTSLHQLQESIQAINFPYHISFEECAGIDDVLIRPAYMEFKDGSEGNVMQQALSIHNVGKKAAIVRLHKPNSMLFDIKADLLAEHKLYPGLSLSAVVRYTYKQSASLHTMIPIEINGNALDYHLICTFSAPHLTAEPATLDFGQVNLESVSDVKTLTIRNTGGKAARFSVDVGTNHMLNIRPDRGLVKSNQAIPLKVQLAGKHEGTFNSRIWIKSSPNICIAVNVEIIRPKLLLECHTKVDESVLIDFPATYLQTRRHRQLTLVNNSSQPTIFVLLSRDQEHFQSISEIDRSKNPNLDVFEMSPSSGRLLPFEEIRLVISFCPTFEALELSRELQKDGGIDHFVAVIKIFKIGAEEAKSVLKMDPKESKKIQQNIPQICAPADQSVPVRSSDEPDGPVDTTLYLHGPMEIPCLDFEPDELVLSDLEIDERVERSICISNPSERLCLKFSYVAKPWIRCQPSQALVQPKQSVQVSISIRAQFNLEALFYLQFDTWAASAGVNEQPSGPSSMINVSRISLRCAYNPLKARGKDTSCRQVCKVASLDKLPRERDLALTHSPSQLALKISHRQYWTHYFRQIFWRECHDNCRDSSTRNAFGGDSLLDGQLRRDVGAVGCGGRSIVRACKPAAPKQSRVRGRLEERLPRLLSPLQLYKVRVSPLKLDFGKMAEDSQSLRQITFENRNTFEVAIGLSCLQEPNVTFVDAPVFALKAKCTLSRSVAFKAGAFGKFSSYLRYRINEQHEYQLPLLANVVFKNLTLKTKELVFDRDCHPLEGYRLAFNVVEIANDLNADTSFKWVLPENANFTIKPPSGCVPANRSLFASVCHQLDPSKANKVEASIQDEDRACVNLKLEAVLRAPNVCLVQDSLDLGQIALNLENRATTALYNAEYFGVFFEVDERSLVKGIYVSPARGIIQPRGIVVLTARFLLDACVECSTQIEIVVQKRLTLQWQVKFAVAFPRLKFEPSVIDWKRVSANSRRVQQLSVTNMSDAEIALSFLLRNFNEFHVSTTDLKSSVPISRGDCCFKIRPKSTMQLFVHFVACDLAHYSIELPIVANGVLGPAAVEDSNSSKPSTFPRTNDEYYSNVKGISFLPIPAKLSTVFVNATVKKALVRFNKLLFQFTDSCRHDKWICCNDSQEKITLNLATRRCSRETDFPFVICWASGVKPIADENGLSISLEAKECSHLRISFDPAQSGRFAFELPINVDQAGNQQTYNQLILDGYRSRACIETDVLRVDLAAVPLTAVAKQAFNLRLSDFAQSSFLCSDIRCSDKCYPAMEISRLLRVIFRPGNEIKAYCSHDVEVEVQFVSDVPVSFCASLLLFDKDRHASLTIGLSARADNSLLSIHAHPGQCFGNFLTRKRPNENRQVDSSDPPDAKGPSENVAQGPLISDRVPEVNLERTSHCESASDLTNDSLENARPCASIDCTIAEIGQNYFLLVARVIQQWLYDDVLNYDFNPNLLDGISLTLLKSRLPDAASTNDKKKEYPKLCTYIDILKRLVDSHESLSFDESTDSKKSSRVSGEDDIAEAVHAHQKIMQWSLSKGALIAHLSAEHLLNYDEYKQLTGADDYLLDADSFRLRSWHAWVDLLLQSYQVFAMAHINLESLANHERLLQHAKSIDSSSNVMYVIDVAAIVKRSERHCHRDAREALLLGWLEYNNALHFEARSLDEFGECLSDSLAFIAVTMNYCPFLKHFFKDVYDQPITNDQKIHNAVCLLLAWKKIRLGFTVMPSQIVDAHAIQMLMLSRHLFKYLPTYLIKSKVTLACPLTKSTCTQIRLSTNLSQQANYVVQFIDNDLDTFTSKPVASIYPQKSQQIKVNFFARKILKIKAYLALCGSSIGPHFAENQVFLLEGYPDELEISENFTFTTKLYQIVKKTLSINVPYDHPKEYEIWISRERLNSIDRLAMTKWEGMQSSRHAFDRLTFQDKNIVVDEQLQTANLTFTLVCLTCESQSFWIVFRSKIADFIIEIVSNYRISITDNLSIEMAKESCTCPDFPLQIDFECPLVHRLLIPSNNIQLHDCILKLFKNSLENEDRMYWTRHLDNAIGLRFIKCITKNDDLFRFKQTYDITTDNNSLLLRVLENLNDGSGIDQIQLTIHICKELASVKKTMITLTSWNEKEVRTCQVDLLRGDSCTGSSRSIL